MYPQYSAISNHNYNDMEKQPLQGDNAYQQQCHCANHNNTCYIESNARRRPSKLALFLFGFLGLIFLGHMFGYHCRGGGNRIGIINKPSPVEMNQEPITANNILQANDMTSANDNLSTNTCLGSDELTIPWEGKSTYYTPQNIKSLKITEKYEHTNTKILKGDIVVVENKSLNQTKIKFDITLDKEITNDQFHIDETVKDKELELTLVHEIDGFYGCIKINALIEVPSTDALDVLNLGFINDDITVKDVLKLNGSLALATANGDITLSDSLLATSSINLATSNGDLTTKNTISAQAINLATSNGDITVEKTATSFSSINAATSNGNIRGVFDLNQAKFNGNTAHGHIHITFDHIEPVSAIKLNSAKGNIDLQVPSDFESKYELSTVVGKADVEATDADKLHYKKTGHIVGETIKGNYGEVEKNPSEIIMSTVAGSVKLSYQ
ncbi:hypothetical protein BJ944DRAFT_259822 [Cunninghamella echinulata]|nr:hypothetical protein BJ944DRAFT_259822 [Cunninghamella echinulata]